MSKSKRNILEVDGGIRFINLKKFDLKCPARTYGAVDKVIGWKALLNEII